MVYGLWNPPELQNYPYFDELFDGVSNIIIRGRVAHLAPVKDFVQSQVSFYPTELSTRELNVFTGPMYVDDDGSTYFKAEQIWGQIKPGKMVYLSPGFLWRYCSPSTGKFIDPVNKTLGPMNIQPPTLMDLADEMYPYYDKPCDLENVIKFLQEANSSRGKVYCRIGDALFYLEAIITPKAFTDVCYFTERACKLYKKNITVSIQDYIVIFNRIYDYDSRSYDDDEKYAVCLLSEMHDIHFKEDLK